MKQRKAAVALTAAMLALAACSTSTPAPKCSDQKVIDVLSHVEVDDFIQKAAMRREELKLQQLSPEKLAEFEAAIAERTTLLKNVTRVYTNIVTKDTNKKTGAHACAATEEASIIKEGQTISGKRDFIYTVKNTYDGKNFTVTTQGLIR